MDARFQRRVQRYGWDRAANAYESGWSEQLRPAQQLLLQLAELRRGEAVLDVACGTGLVSLAAAHAVGPTGRVVGVDLSDEMVAIAATTVVTSAPCLTAFRQCDAERLDLGEERFDAALCALGLMYVADAVAALREQWNALRPGGRAVSAVWGARTACGWASIFPIVDARVQSEVCPLFFRLGTGDALANAFADAGFVDVASRRIRTTLEYASDQAALDAAFAAGPVALAYSRFDDAARRTAHAEYLASIAPHRHGDGYRIPGEFVVTRGTRPPDQGRRTSPGPI